ncbi:MAG: thioredoxin family protein [Anaerolineales bacterium]|uniref:Thioredoxin family protein n=1 Tax=candidate division WWE3 bacterium TaxID=2053526 RepID=A0A928Y667_UNCKA|nr:thioredoxin family protein [Anaerolineales bacterium]MBE7525217.1 thioredoxin family protein [candidate division WWE3 bacterium]
MKTSPVFFATITSLALLGQGCLASPSPSATLPEPALRETSQTPPEEGGPKIDADENLLSVNTAGTATYSVYTKDAYEAARKNGNPIILFFYANWCPTCSAEEPVFRTEISQTARAIKAFRVNYKDTDTDEDERSLAKTFDIFLQHTFIYLNSDGTEYTRTIGTQGGNTIRRNIKGLR